MLLALLALALVALVLAAPIAYRRAAHWSALRAQRRSAASDELDMPESRRTTLSIREREAPTTALVPAEELKRYLPGVEPERRLNDWGRSERIEGLMAIPDVIELYDQVPVGAPIYIA